MPCRIAERADEKLLRSARRLPERQHPGAHGLVRLRIVVRQLPHRRVDLGLRRGPVARGASRPAT